MSAKTVKVSAKVDGEIEQHEIEILGIKTEERLTPKLAAQAALIAFGHRSGVTVSDTMTAYRVYAKSCRKLSV